MAVIAYVVLIIDHCTWFFGEIVGAVGFRTRFGFKFISVEDLAYFCLQFFEGEKIEGVMRIEFNN